VIPAGDDTQVRPAQASAWNIANALTLLRIALVPVFAYFLMYDGGQLTTYRLLAAGVFVVATATDRIDGDIARARGLVTDFGKVSDPIADKLLMGAALIGLSMLDLLPWWVTVLVLFRELGITALRFVVIRHGVMPASRGGKLKTALQAVAILLYILPLSSAWHWLAVLAMTLAVIVTVLTGIDYVLRAHTLRNTSPRAQLKRERRAAAAQVKQARDAPVAPDVAGPDASARNPSGSDGIATEAAAPDAPAGRGAGPEV
jgi:CDP-diacylglycerol--glycerol-3-phosphate 3-phosphatidyltransferase